jgi:hypothetical protein
MIDRSSLDKRVTGKISEQGDRAWENSTGFRNGKREKRECPWAWQYSSSD